jgi:hypothetical protein
MSSLMLSQKDARKVKRLLGYALCAACDALPDRAMHVEARIQADLVGHANSQRPLIV